MSLKEYIEEQETAHEVSGNLMDKTLDILRHYIDSEFRVSDEEKEEILDNLDIRIESHNKGVWKKGPKLVATSHFIKDDKDEREVEITVEIITEKF